MTQRGLIPFVSLFVHIPHSSALMFLTFFLITFFFQAFFELQGIDPAATDPGQVALKLQRVMTFERSPNSFTRLKLAAVIASPLFPRFQSCLFSHLSQSSCFVSLFF